MDGSGPWSSLTPHELIAACLQDLRVIACGLFRKERRDHTLQPTALVNEFWRRLPENVEATFSNKEAFLAWAATCMRHILVDHARSRQAARRGGSWRRSDLSESACDAARHANAVRSAGHGRELRLDELEDEIRFMERSHPRSARVFEMRFYGGMTNGQIARVLDVSPRVVQEDWNIAKLWLRRRFDESPQE